MGNANQRTGSGKDKLNQNVYQGSLLLFHQTHSPTVRLSLDRRLAKRFDGIKGICFSDRPVQIGDLITLRILETSNARNGALRFGFTCEDPTMIEPVNLIQYASPDLTCEQGYWAKAVPEKLVLQGNVLGFWLSPEGDVLYGCNGNRLGIFFRGVHSNVPMWAMLDVFGSTIAVTLIDEELPIVSSEELYALSSACLKNASPCLSSLGPPPSRSLSMQPKSSSRRTSKDPPSRSMTSSHELAHRGPADVCKAVRETRSAGSTPAIMSNTLVSKSVLSKSQDVNVLCQQRCQQQQQQNSNAQRSHETMPFHYAIGRNICLSSDRTIATRLSEDYCNGYVFTSRPLRPGERLTIEVTGIDLDYVGGLAFGMTACDPTEIRVCELPDDSDQLIDRPEYWVVHKDVYVAPEVGDKLAFYLTSRGEVRFDRNGCPVATLMHVDTTLELWAFIDVYGTTQRIKSCGVTSKTLPHRNCQKAANEDMRCQFAKSLGKLNLTSPRHQCQAASSAKEAMNHSSSNRIVLDSRKAEASSRSAASSGYKGSLSGPPRLLPQEILDPFLDVPVTLPPPLIPTPAFAKGSMSQSLNPTKRPVPVPHSDPSFSYPDLLSSEVIIGYALEKQKVTTGDVVGVRDSKSRCDAVALRQNQLAGAGDEVLTAVNYENLNCGWELQKVLNEKLSVAVDDPKVEKLDFPGAECAVCLERPPDCALYTCGHMCMCYECAMSVMKRRGAICPICRKPVLDVIKIFKS